jgi:hypothetical protein
MAGGRGVLLQLLRQHQPVKLSGSVKIPAKLKAALGPFKVQAEACRTCIYRNDNPLDLEALEEAVRDEHLGFRGFRICHHSNDACCRGFWNAHKDEFAAGQIAQRLGLVEFVNDDTLCGEDTDA